MENMIVFWIGLLEYILQLQGIFLQIEEQRGGFRILGTGKLFCEKSWGKRPERRTNSHERTITTKGTKRTREKRKFLALRNTGPYTQF